MKPELRIYQLAMKISMETSIHCDRMEKNAETCKECKKRIQYYCEEIKKIAKKSPRRKLMFKILKSKTIDFNILAGAIIGGLEAFGVSVPPEVVVPVFSLGNILLRLVTKEPISEK